MSFYMWLFSVKKLADRYSRAIKRYRKLPDEEKLELYREFCNSKCEKEEKSD